MYKNRVSEEENQYSPVLFFFLMWSAHLLCFRLFLNYCLKPSGGFQSCVPNLQSVPASYIPSALILTAWLFPPFLDLRLTRSDLTQTNGHITQGPRALAIDKPQPSDCKPIQQEKRDSSGKIVSNKRAQNCQGLELYAWVCFMLNPFLRPGDSLMYCLEFTLFF